MKHILKFASSTALSFVLLSSTAFADWTLDNSKSALYFVSIKKDHIAETNTFKTLSGLITTAGQGSLNIDLSSVSTNVDIRDQRVRDYLFDTKTFSNATVSIDLGTTGIKPGIQTVNATLGLHGMKKDITATVAVTEVGDTIQVATVAPILLNAADFDLAGGLTMLREIGAVSSISNAVPVTFFLSFVKQV
ncbi:YceI family protein [Thiothrix lacustris]|uniref:YceI family protein n=1 Tax=Thiothrix lacustris TaxID=525917 RepID=A0ABY9MN82_9GAMM|nr:YceI family protein [Thiothrix lacustris]WML90032.1 YceI family protein [Thiothrix lacustris]WMP18365.1 YceI family protein [Thiothrix lacustris]